MKVINVKDFQDHSIPKYENLDEINPEGLVRDKDHLKENDILFVRSNGNRNLIGRTLFIKGKNEILSHSAFTIRARFHSDEVDPRFYAYLFRSHLIRDVLTAYGGGTNISNLNQSILKGLQVPLPPIGTQQEIASILSAYDDLIENNTRRIQILEEMAQAIYREWFVNFRFPGHEKVRMVDSPLGKIPEGWEVVSFMDMSDVFSGGTPKTTVPEFWNGDIPFFAPKDAPSFFYVAETEKSITDAGLHKCSSRLYPKDTVFITARGTVGKVVMPVVDMAMNQSCYALRGRDSISQYFVFLAVKECVQQLQQRAQGAVFDTIIVDTFRRLEVVKPPLSSIEEISSLVDPIFKQILNLLTKNASLRRTRDLLLPKLISGEVDVDRVVEIRSA